MAQVVLDIVYKTKGMQGLAKSQQELNKASRAANTGANSIKKFDRAVLSAGRSSRSASAGVKAFGAATVGATGSLKAFGAAMASYLAPVAAIAAAVGALAKSFQIAGEREADARALANGLNKIGAEKGALDSLQASADKLGKTTLFNQEDFTKGYKLLTSFRNIGLSSYEDVSKAAADMATVIGGDINSSLLQLSKALEDPSKGLTYLSRSGTTFTDSQKEMIKSLQESGNLLGAQAEIMKVVEAQYGGAAEAAGKSGLAGAFDSMMEVLRDAGEVIGKALEPLAVGAMQLITNGVKALGDVWANLQTQVFPGVKKSLDPILQLLKDIYNAIDWASVAKLVGVVLVGAFKALEFALKPVLFIFEQMLKGLKALMESPVGQVLGNAFKLVAGALGGANKEAESLKENTEAAVKPVEDLKQSIEETQEPLKTSAGSADELKTNMEGAATATGNAKTKADELAGSLGNAAQQSQAIKQPVTAAAAETEKASGAVIRFNDGLKKSVKPAQQVAKASEATQKANKKSVTYHPPVSREMKVQKGLAMDMNQLVQKMLKDKLDLHDTDQATRQVLEQQFNTLKAQEGATRQAAYEAGYNRELQHQIGQELDRNNTKIEQMVAGLWNGANAAGAMADNLARASAISGGGGGGSKKSVSTRNANGVSNYRHNGGLFIPSYLISGEGDTQRISTEKFGNVTYEQYKYLAENPTHGLKHYEQHKKQQREEQKKIQYEVQHGPGSYESSFSKTSSRYKEMQKSQGSNVNVNYTGSTLSFNGGEYVQKGDVKGIVNSAVGATLKTLSSSSSARLRSGMR